MAPPTASAATPTDLPPTPVLLDGQAAAIANAMADLAARLDIPAESVKFIRLFADDLPAQDLGCSTKATPAVVQPSFVTGWVIYLGAGDAQYEYRAHASQMVYCGET